MRPAATDPVVGATNIDVGAEAALVGIPFLSDNSLCTAKSNLDPATAKKLGGLEGDASAVERKVFVEDARCPEGGGITHRS